MHSEQINRVSSRVAVGLSGTALLAVLSGYFEPPQTDEGSAAHIFQLSIALLVGAILASAGKADWKQPWRSLRAIAAPAIMLLIAVGGLYYLEHYRF